jgi:formylglycine-generating enzyme required for sulfatase activity
MVHPIELADPVIPEPINLQAVLLEDTQEQRDGGSSRFAICRAVNVSPKTHGVWEDVDEDTLLWRVPITSPGALSLSLGFSRYSMPPGGRLYIYSADRTQVLGPFTAKDNKKHGQLWTALIHSDSIVVELVLPLLEVPKMQVELTYVNHGYRDPRASLVYQDLGDAASCQRNVACFEGDSRRDQIRSVARYQITRTGDGGVYYDTGVLLNTTAEDDRPYFLTAFHSFDELPKDQVLNDWEKAYAASMIIYWNFQAATCYENTGSESQQQHGAEFLAGNSQTDFVLVKLNDTPSPAFNVYYAGWDRTNVTPSSGFAIHHPRGDLKKISVESDPLISWSPSFVSGVNYGTCFYVVGWDSGTGMTQDGSSGCPLFNSEKRVVGQLIGGAGTCADPGSTVSTFGPLYRSWSEGEPELLILDDPTLGLNRETRLSDWLDPLNTGVASLDGKNPGGARALPSDLVEVVGAQYASLDGLAPGSKEAQDRQKQAVQQFSLPLEVKTRQTGIVFRLVPAGTFMMGSPPSESQRYDDEGPQHQVTLTKPFYCGKVEVTQGQWRQVMGSNPSYYNSAGQDAPAEKVLWNDCQAFVKALCQMEGVLEGTYRFLTEAEWEYACRAGSTSAYFFGDTDSLLGQYAWYNGNSGQSHPVGRKKPNAFGLYDMHGNVWEWCQDWLGDYYAGPVTDPLGPRSGGNRVLRGGSWYDDAGDCRSAIRGWFTPVRGFSNVGLRFARTAPTYP